MSFPFFPRGLFNQKNGFISENAVLPSSNTGGTFTDTISQYQFIVGLGNKKIRIPSDFLPSLSVTDNLERVKKPKDTAFIDTISFTFKSKNFYKAFPESTAISSGDDDYASEISKHLLRMIGFGATKKNEHGRNFYKNSYDLGDGWGFIAVGGDNQRDTLQVYLSGQACIVALEGWELSLFDFLTAVGGKITRVDIAHDFFDGGYSVDNAYADLLAGHFKDKYSPKNPMATKGGCWDFEALGLENKGRTLYVGNRKSKIIRIYEKGLQLTANLKNADNFESFKNWVRVELELHSSEREIPLDVLLNSAQYLAGSAPALAFISEKQERIKVKKRTFKAQVENIKQNIKKQFGKGLNLLNDLFCLDDDCEQSPELVVKLFNSLLRDGYPKSLFHFNLSRCPSEMDFSENADLAIAKAF